MTTTAPTDTVPPAAGPADRVDIAAAFPAGYRALAALEAATRRSTLPESTRELVKIRSSQINGCAYCLDMHVKDALAAGDTVDRTTLVAVWREATCFTEPERAALALAEAVTRIADGPVPTAVEAEARRHYDDEAYAALVFTIVVINGWNRVAIAAHNEPGHYQPGDFDR